MSKRNKGSKSPYVRYAKSPYRYSELHTRWKDAVLRRDFAMAARFSSAWYFQRLKGKPIR